MCTRVNVTKWTSFVKKGQHKFCIIMYYYKRVRWVMILLSADGVQFPVKTAVFSVFFKQGYIIVLIKLEKYQMPREAQVISSLLLGCHVKQ